MHSMYALLAASDSNSQGQETMQTAKLRVLTTVLKCWSPRHRRLLAARNSSEFLDSQKTFEIASRHLILRRHGPGQTRRRLTRLLSHQPIATSPMPSTLPHAHRKRNRRFMPQPTAEPSTPIQREQIGIPLSRES